MINKKILMTIILGMFLISFASAINWDNKMKYNEDSEEIIVDNFFGLGGDLIKAQLKENGCDNQGRYCQASLPIALYEDGKLIEDRRFYRMTEDETYLSDIRWSKLEYWNGSNWIEFDENDEFIAGDYLVAFSGEIKPGWQYDWQLKIKGKWTTPWAVWGNISEGDDAEVILNSPADESIIYDTSVTFNASANVTGGAYLTNMSLWMDSGGGWYINETETDYFIGELLNLPDELTHWGPDSSTFVLIETYIFENNTYINNLTEHLYSNDHTGGGNWDRYKFYYTDGSSYTNDNPCHSCNSDFTITNINPEKSIWYVNYYMNVYGSGDYIRRTNFVMNGENKSTYLTKTFSKIIAEDMIWNVQSCDTDGGCGFAENNYTLYVDSTTPNITLNYPFGILNYNKINDTLQLNITATDVNLDSVWYNYNGTNITIDGAVSGEYNLSNITLSSKKYVTIYANDTIGNLNATNFSWDYKIFENNRTLNNESYDTQEETFSINVTANSSLTSVKLLYNGTEYSTTNSNGVYSTTLDIPVDNTGNMSIRWKFTYAGDTIYSDYSYQEVTGIVFDYCNATLTDKFLNFTFKDEDDFEILNATIPLGTFNYHLGSGAEYKTTTYTNTSLNYEYDFCSNADDEILTLDYSLQYASEDYPQRISQELIEVTTNLTDKTLYLLNVADGLYVTFQVINTAEQAVEGVSVNATREISGENVLVGIGNTDAGGGITFWLNPDFLHTFNFDKTGYDLFTTSLFPTQTIYTINIGGGTPDEHNDYSRGISYDISPKNTLLSNNTNYTFELEFLSTYWTIDSFGFNLYDENNTIIASESLSDNGGTLSVTEDTETNANITMVLYWIVDGNSTNATRVWIVYDDEAGNSLSIKAFFTDLTTYVNSGLFGLDNFGLGILLFLVIFGTTGVVSWKFGIRSPAAISGMLFLLVLLFDVGLGMFANLNPVGAVEHFPTIFVGFITLGLLIKEGVR